MPEALQNVAQASSALHAGAALGCYFHSTAIE